MPHYIVLANFTDEGIRTIRDLPKQGEANTQRMAAAGITVQRFFTLGQYDAVTLVEAPNDEVMATLVLAIGSQGNFRSTTLKAFTDDEFSQLIERLPSS